MGYTHYWEGQRSCTDMEWQRIRAAVLQLLGNNQDIPVVWESDCDGVKHQRKVPEISRRLIRFNGPGDEGFETFLVDRVEPSFAFCKTGRLPYDALVVATLTLMEHYAAGAWRYKTDGEGVELDEGLMLAADVVGVGVKSPFTNW